MPRPEPPSSAPKFEEGDKVRVKYGVMSPEYEEIPLGGWTGRIESLESVDGEIGYDIELDQRTLDLMHPVYRKRCERDDLDVEWIWLFEEELEADDGTPVPIEQPAEIRTPPLSEKNREDRIRMVFGLTHDDPLPMVSEESLLAYHRYLATRLKFPFHISGGWEPAGPFSQKKGTWTITNLEAPEEGAIEDEERLICEGRNQQGEPIALPLHQVEVPKKDPNFKAIDDYAYWFANG
jgi:hypothetical protein